MQNVKAIRDDLPESEGNRTRVLVVDDVPTNRAVIRSLLSRPSYYVVEASDGKEALHWIAGEPFDLVILDVLMPGLNGIDVLKDIRKRYTESELPVLMLTVKDDIDDIVKALEYGANDYVTRPIDYSVLLARINTLISYKQTQDSVRESQSVLESRIAERTTELLEANRALRAEVAERKHAEEQARFNQDRYRVLYDDTPSMFLTLDVDAQILSVNGYGAEQLGYEVADLVGKSVLDLCHPGERKSVMEQFNSCLANPDRVHRWESCLLRKDSSPMWVRETARVIDGEIPGTKSLLVVCEDITEARTLSEQLNYQSKHDSLTGLVNRREFELRLQRVLERARRDGSHHALCYMDLDQFKIVNDTCGHVAGDELLRQLTTVLQKFIQPNDTLARLGGDEFAVLLTDRNLEQAAESAQCLSRAIVDYRFLWGESTYSISTSIGLIPIDARSESIADLLSAADTACYASKEQGHNRIHVYRKDDEELVKRHGEMTWVTRIARALDENRFELYFQTIVPVEMAANDAPHYEILLRMQDEEGNLVTPSMFLPAAERYKHAVNIDRWVVKNALTWLADHRNHRDRLFICSLNLSGHSLGDHEFLRFVLDQFEFTGTPTHKICFEVTETAAIANLSSASRFIKEIRKKECRFALDDFGSGLSSFAYLKSLPVDFIKIDGLFIRDIADDPIDLAMVRSINEIAKVMGKQTIAEFVEKKEILDRLVDIGVDYAQGNSIATPQPRSSLAH
jgi:diguanylate cyclase (GGDEF)-like protein/PAS domain S-box-containing protein